MSRCPKGGRAQVTWTQESKPVCKNTKPSITQKLHKGYSLAFLSLEAAMVMKFDKSVKILSKSQGQMSKYVQCVRFYCLDQVTFCLVSMNSNNRWDSVTTASAPILQTDCHLRDLQQTFSELKYSPEEVKTRLIKPA